MNKKLILGLFFFQCLLMLVGCGSKIPIHEKNGASITNKIIPEEISEEIKIALSYYPQLKNVPIEFQFKNDIEKSFMQAQPKFSAIFHGRDHRGYNIFISEKVTIEGHDFAVKDVPKKVLIGWLGHELGHIMDYRDRSAFGLIIFGLRYISSENYIKKAEKMADVYAVQHGMGDYILATKNFILNHSKLSDAYKKRIARLYLSPEEIVALVNKLEKDAKEAGEKDS